MTRRVPMILQSEAPECGIACRRDDRELPRLPHRPLGDAPAARALDEGRHAQAHRAIARDDEADGARRAGAARERSAKLRLPGDPALGHEPFRRADARSAATRSRCTIRPRGRRVLRARRGLAPLTPAWRWSCTPAAGFQRATSARRSAPWQLLNGRHGPARARSRRSCCSRWCSRSCAIAIALLPAARRRPRGRRPRPRFADRARHRFRRCCVMIAVVDDRGACLAGRLHQHATQPAAARHTVRPLLRLPLAWFEKRHIGDIVSRFRSVDAIQRTLTLDVRRDGDRRRDGANHVRRHALVSAAR